MARELLRASKTWILSSTLLFNQRQNLGKRNFCEKVIFSQCINKRMWFSRQAPFLRDRNRLKSPLPLKKSIVWSFKLCGMEAWRMETLKTFNLGFKPIKTFSGCFHCWRHHVLLQSQSLSSKTNVFKFYRHVMIHGCMWSVHLHTVKGNKNRFTFKSISGFPDVAWY